MTPALPGQVIYASSGLLIRHVPAVSPPGDAVVVTFPDMLHPGIQSGTGFAESSLAKRGISQVAVLPRRSDWFQTADFLPAMKAVRQHLGPEVPLTTYGFSMGGYGAILAAKALDARLAVALAPQFSLDPAVVPGDLRFAPQAAEIGPFCWDVAAEMADGCCYQVLHDPLHRLDRLNARLFGQAGARLMPVHGARHHIIPCLIEAGVIESLFDVLRGAAAPQALRQAYRAGRRTNRHWIRRVGKYCAAQGHRLALAGLIELADMRGMRGPARDWREVLAKPARRVRSSRG
ncbi:alpha/beta fold hydrolase [Rhodobacter ferrooxidans]|uniref:Alpha/beta hydrolase n=1 Tax=Rhodobacter ferrooxidans TaxID=371731 RepID=C8RX08_9RHOB|nr:alpha/beta hydrolase [Rhodobacter sp. SW2]EEW26533.1 hypothetical protein Rsw2DRAFT_0336 [Rhodobacter sp. SW2]